MKKLLFLLFAISFIGLNANAQDFSNDEIANAIEVFVNSSRSELPDPFLFSYEGEEMLVYKSTSSRGSCYAYFTISPPQGCVGDMFEVRTVFVTGSGPWTTIANPGNITANPFYHVATGLFQFNITAIDANNCVVTNSQPITAQVNPAPTVSISTIGKECYNIFVANTADCSGITWSNSHVGPVAEFLPGNGYAYVTVENSFGCSAKDSIWLSAPCMPVDTHHIIVYDTTHFIVYDTVEIIVYDTVGCNSGGGENDPCSGTVIVRSHPSDEPIKFCPSHDSDGILTLQALVPSANQNTILYQWVGQNIVGNTNKSSVNIAPTQNQVYTLIIKLDENDGGCIFTEVFNVVIDCTTASHELDPDKIVITSSEGTVKVSAEFTEYKVSLVDIAGREVVNQSCSQTESIISTDNLASGWYAVRIFADNKICVKPIVVLH